MSPAQAEPPPSEPVGTRLLEQALDRPNMQAALRRVLENKGAPGVDGMTVHDLRLHLKTNWESIRAPGYSTEPIALCR